MISLSSISELVTELQKFGALLPKALIGIDGNLASGKSTLARRLGGQLDARVVEGDLFLVAPNKPYPEALDLICLSNVIKKACTFSRPIIFESVMLHRVLDRLHLEPAAVIYVRRCWPTGVASCANLCHLPSSEYPLMGDSSDVPKIAPIPDSTPQLLSDVLRYHRVERQHERADILYDAVFRLGG